MKAITYSLLFVGGLCLACYGVGLIYRPAGFIVGGLLISALSFVLGQETKH